MRIKSSIVTTVKMEQIDKDVVHLSMPLMLKAKSYSALWAFRNHIHVSNVELNLSLHHIQVVTLR
jgi:hypothetical protein